ncbi:MAG: pyridoxamine 5'-phosphate oxidase family protein [Proteobacteria bacterium]|nr:pyridoxamine 5'-phosphate oxidase family protein [Pseudomonadota bacterium]
MSDFLGDDHRTLQDRFGTRRLSERIEQVAVNDRVGKADRAFIESRDMFFLASVTADGQPTVSYKGGEKGFVRLLDEKTVVFPCYDGNGMYYSMGNIANNGKLGLLFMDFETPHRLRLEGTASLIDDDVLLNSYPEAELLVRIAVGRVFVNCPRYVHRYSKVETSPYVPREGQATPLPAWKRIVDLQDVLPPLIQDKVAKAGGTISGHDYKARLRKGDA